MGYKTTQELTANIFGGLNAVASMLTVGNTEASTLQNWDIGRSGAITKRAGYVVSASNPGNGGRIMGLMAGHSTNGAMTWWAVATTASTSGFTVWEAPLAPTAAWTERFSSAKFGTTTTDVNGLVWIGHGYMANGVDDPLYVSSGSAAKTVEEASLLSPVTGITGFSAFTGGSRRYAVTALTARGQTPVSQTLVVNGAVTPSVAEPTILSWTPVVGASSYRLLRQIGEECLMITEVPASSTTASDTGQTMVAGTNPPTVNTAYNTPNAWNTTPPKGFIAVARGRDERLLAWAGQNVWASALRDGLNWFAPQDAFQFFVTGGTDNNVVGIASLFDYIVVLTSTDCLLYTGASIDTITLQKVIPIGCVSSKSVVYAGEGDVYFWSQYGPVRLSRIVQGADVAAAIQFNDRIRPHIIANTNRSAWSSITGVNDITTSRITWAVPGTGQTKNTLAYVYQYDVDAFSHYTNWQWADTIQHGGFTIYGIRSTSPTVDTIATMSTGLTDNGTPIVAVYKTGWMDMRSWVQRKRVTWCDVVTDRTVGAYAMTFGYAFDYERVIGPSVVCTPTTTDGATIYTTSPMATEHRVYMAGIGNAFQLTFTSSDANGCRILGWRPYVVMNGVRSA